MNTETCFNSRTCRLILTHTETHTQTFTDELGPALYCFPDGFFDLVATYILVYVCECKYVVAGPSTNADRDRYALLTASHADGHHMYVLCSEQ